MGPSRGVLRNAIVTTVLLAAVCGAGPAAAQRLEASLRALDYAPDPIARSPRLLGMGRLTLADDTHNRIDLWDFAGNPVGIAAAESVSVLEYRPLVRNRSVLRDILTPPPVRERQELAARSVRHGLETWRRQSGSPAYGLLAEVVTLDVDRPYGHAVERRGRIALPALLGAVNGRVPWLKTDRIDYALRLGYSLETFKDGYYEFLSLPEGDYLGHESAIVPPPDLFTPDRSETSNLQGGVGLGWRVTRGIRAAVQYDRARVKVRSKHEGLRSTSKVDEDRPFDLGQASLVGRLGPHLEWGADGRAWRSSSEEFFFWSVSAGPTQGPLGGSGKRLDREEKGTALRTRVRWTQGALELGAAFGTTFRREIIRPWYRTSSGDPVGFNDFLDEVGTRPGADTLLLPARVRASHVDERGIRFSGGGAWRLPGERGVVGAEFHRWRLATDEVAIGSGPRPTGWEMRLGAEVRCSRTLRARAGWNYGIHDADDLTADNADRSVVATGGFGYSPAGARWSMDLGYAYQWDRPDYVDPARVRGNGQQLAVQMRWPF